MHDRDALIDRLVSHGVVSGYVYDPPLDDYAGAEFVEPSPDPSAARWFASHVLPADPLVARKIARALTKERTTPASWQAQSQAQPETQPQAQRADAD